jgi:hypothetical protein
VCVFAMLIYIPIGYWFDSWMYRASASRSSERPRLHRRPGGRELLLRRARRRDAGDRDRPRRGGRAPDRGARRPRPERRGDPAHAHALRPRRRGRARSPATPARRSTARSSRSRCSPTS